MQLATFAGQHRDVKSAAETEGWSWQARFYPNEEANRQPLDLVTEFTVCVIINWI
jgi:hypothetical protein